MAHLTPETRRKRRKAFCLIIEIICLVHFAIIVPRDRVFTPENWAHTPAPMRHKLMWSFHRQYQLGMTTRKKWRSSWARVTTLKEVLSTSWLTIGLVAGVFTILTMSKTV